MDEKEESEGNDFELEKAEIAYYTREAEQLVMDEAYASFYNKGSLLSKKRYENIAKKRELLGAIFPEQFGKDGRESVYEMTDGKIGVLFNSMLSYSEKRVNELEEKARVSEQEMILKRFKERTSYP